MPQSQTFSFGANWRRFQSRITEERVKNAARSLTDFLELENFEGRSFLDVGCGSGLFSLAASSLGAKRVISFDRDPLSIECCRRLRRRVNDPPNWEIHQGSILDPDFTSGLGSFDIVYAWGTLQHTGKMWEALKRSAALVKPGGYLYIAVYNQVDGWLGSKFWLKFKRAYNALPRPGQLLVDMAAIPIYFAARSLHAKSLVPDVQNYESSRGMYWRTDLTDWLGGLPYECATVEQVFRFVKANCRGLSLHNLKTTNSLANNWFLLKRENAPG
ncbi:MAG: class I SAM-dependent methyltransferase [Acidobacteriia bacterium]|nr:class I SAM-dependent methyltransferase [Terriglobia bacterium]